jgi:hypothetical protein
MMIVPGRMPHPFRAWQRRSERHSVMRRDLDAKEHKRQAAVEDSREVDAAARTPIAAWEEREATQRSELDGLLSRAAARIAAEETDRHILQTLPAALGDAYDQQVWTMRNPSVSADPAAYRRYRFYRWQERNHDRVAAMGLDDRWEEFRGDEAWARCRSGLPPRDDYEQDAYAEWRQLDAEAAEDAYLYRLRPEQLYEQGRHGFTSWDDFYSDYLQQMHDEEEAAGPASIGSCPGTPARLPGCMPAVTRWTATDARKLPGPRQAQATYHLPGAPDKTGPAPAL